MSTTRTPITANIFMMEAKQRFKEWQLTFEQGRSWGGVDQQTVENPRITFDYKVGLSANLRTERSPVESPVRAQAWVADQVPGWGPARGNQWMFLFHMDVSLPLFLPSFPSL